MSIIRYEAYKDSGVEWLGEVPAHWIKGRVKDFVNTNTLTKIPSGLLPDSLIEFIPMSNVDDIAGKINEFNFVPLKEVSVGYTKFKNRDVIFAKITPCMENGNCAIVSGLTQDICFGSTEFMIFRVYQNLTEKYLHYYLHNDLFRRNAEPFMRGTAGQRRISSHFMATHFFGLPPFDEQIAIANYLDTKTAQIDRKIDLLSKKATQYGKLKQSLINETVTRGLDKTVPMKDSGVEWIGEVSAHWKIKRLEDVSFIIDPQPDHRAPAFAEGDGYPYIGIRDLNKDGSLNFETARKVELTAVEKQEQSFKVVSGDILFCKVGTLGEPRIIIAKGRFALSATLVLIKVNNNASNSFLKYALDSSCIFDQINYFGSGSTRPALGIKQIRKFYLPFPLLSEQQAIATYLDEKIAHIDRIVSTINTQIDKLKELRKALINDVVTGKICVLSESVQAL